MGDMRYPDLGDEQNYELISIMLTEKIFRIDFIWAFSNWLPETVRTALSTYFMDTTKNGNALAWGLA
jgi:hypothetical protein